MAGPRREHRRGDLLDDLAAEQHTLQDRLRGARRRRLAAPDPGAGLGRARHGRAPRRHRRDGDRDRDRRARLDQRACAARPRRARTSRTRACCAAAAAPGRDVLAWWESTSAAEHEMFRALDPERPRPVGHRDAPAVVRHRPAHGDVGARSRRARRARRRAVDTDRLAHVAWLATRALPYAYSVAGREPPAEPAAGRADAAVGRGVEHRARRRGRIASPARPASTAGCSCTG